jgi:hypothetical protein
MLLNGEDEYNMQLFEKMISGAFDQHRVLYFQDGVKPKQISGGYEPKIIVYC